MYVKNETIPLRDVQYVQIDPEYGFYYKFLNLQREEIDSAKAYDAENTLP